MARPPKNSTLAPMGASTGTRAAGRPRAASPAANASRPINLSKPLWTKIPPMRMRPSKRMTSPQPGATRSINGVEARLSGSGLDRGDAVLISLFSSESRVTLAGGPSHEIAEAARHGVDRRLGCGRQSVALREPARLVIGQPNLAIRILPDQRLQWQVDADGLVGLHQRRARLGVAEHEHLGRPQRQA